MKAETEQLLDKLAAKHDKRGKGVDHAAFIKARGSGLPLADAVKAAGSTMKSRTALQVYGTNLMKSHPEYQPAVLDILREKQAMMLDAMTKDKMENASLSSLTVGVGILTDKIELLSGRPTERTEGAVNLDELDKQRLLGFILGRLSAGNQPKK